MVESRDEEGEQARPVPRCRGCGRSLPDVPTKPGLYVVRCRECGERTLVVVDDDQPVPERVPGAEGPG